MSAAGAVVLAVSAAACIAAVRRPFVGLLAYLWLDYMRPNDFFVELRDYRVMLVLGAVTAAATAWHRRAHLFEHWRELAPVAALVVVVAFATATSIDPLASSSELVQAMKMLVLVWMIATLVSSADRARMVVWTICGSLAVLAAAAVAQAIERGLFEEFRQAAIVHGPVGLNDGPLRDNNDLARVLSSALPLWWILAASAGPLWGRAAAAAGFALTVAGIEATFSRSGFLAMVAAVAVVSFSYRTWQRRAAILLSCVAALVLLSPRPYLERVVTLARPHADISFLQRASVWREGLDMALAAPLHGQGPGTFLRGVDSPWAVRRSPHNVFVEVLAELGFVGLAVYGWMLIATLARLHRARRTATFAIAAALIAYLTASMALSTSLASPLFVLIGLAIAVGTLACKVPLEGGAPSPPAAGWGFNRPTPVH
jgi:hypothetical protein